MSTIKSRSSCILIIVMLISVLISACSPSEAPEDPGVLKEPRAEEFHPPDPEQPPQGPEEPPPGFEEPPPDHEMPPPGGEEPPPGFEEPPMEPPAPESQGQQPEPQEPDPRTDMAITDIYPDNLPIGNLFVRITNHGPVVMMAAPVELTCRASGKRRGNQPGEDNLANTVQLVVQIAPGETTNEDTGIRIDANLFEYFVECSFHSELDKTPQNNQFQETIPNP